MKPIMLLFFVQIFVLLFNSSVSIKTNYTSIFSFGDSYLDTGNLVILYGGLSTSTPGVWIAKPPYGMTFFKNPTGRASDGRLAIDFIAEALGLPLLPPSLAANQRFRQGANFAVGGATALERAFFVDNGFKAVSQFNISLSVQLGWFDALKPSLCSSPQACQEYMAQALFFVGELGWNDYAVMLLAGNKSVNEVASHVPEIIGKIYAATEKLVNDGGKTVVVSGIPPLGCAAGNLALFANRTGADYEPETGCLKNLNLLSKNHNLQLRQALARLNGRYPDTRIVYADFYTPIIDFVTAPDQHGFAGRDGALKACCGGGGQYNFNLTALCGMPGVSACADPAAFVDWDGVHLTEGTNRRIADGWLWGPYAHPPILKTY